MDYKTNNLSLAIKSTRAFRRVLYGLVVFLASLSEHLNIEWQKLAWLLPDSVWEKGCDMVWVREGRVYSINHADVEYGVVSKVARETNTIFVRFLSKRQMVRDNFGGIIIGLLFAENRGEVTQRDKSILYEIENQSKHCSLPICLASTTGKGCRPEDLMAIEDFNHKTKSGRNKSNILIEL